MVIRKGVTLEEFQEFYNSLEDDDHIYELIDGEIVSVSPSFESSEIGMEIGAQIRNYNNSRNPRPGRVTGADGGYVMPTNEEFNPDVGYISRERMPDRPGPGKPVPMPPDFAVEVVSPSDLERRTLRIDKKLKTYLECKIALLWYVNPNRREVDVYTHGAFVRTATEADTLDGGDVLPGFTVRVSDIFLD